MSRARATGELSSGKALDDRGRSTVLSPMHLQKIAVSLFKGSLQVARITLAYMDCLSFNSNFIIFKLNFLNQTYYSYRTLLKSNLLNIILLIY